jgi:acyl-CoA thioesterase
MNIDELLSLGAATVSNPNSQIVVPKSWAQGRTVYGGLSAGVLYAAAKGLVAPERIMRSMSTNFVGPLLAETPFEISVEIVREGKNVSQIQARAIQENKICVVSQICFAQSRESNIKVENNDTHQMGLPSKGNFIPQIPKVTPKFLKHIDLSFEAGGIPFTGRKTSIYQGWMRFKQAPSSFTDAHLVSLIDAWPPPLLQMLKWPAPASTVSWNLEFLHPHSPINPTDWLAYQSSTRQAGDGYGHTEANIWDTQGKLIAISRQTVAVFD